MSEPSPAVIFVQSDAPPPPPEGIAPVTPEALTRAFHTFALALAKEALLSPEERAAKATEIAAYVSKLLGVINLAAHQWPACTPAFPSSEDVRAGIPPPDRTCQHCSCWRQYYDAWKQTTAPPWWPNPNAATREELEAWVAKQTRRTHPRNPAPGAAPSDPTRR